MLQKDEPEDFVIATGHSHSVREFLKKAFCYVDLDYEKYLVIDETLYRPAEVKILQGDATKAKIKLKWSPEISFSDLIKEMVDGDINWYKSQR